MIYSSKNLIEFIYNFNKINNENIENIIYDYVLDTSQALFVLVGSIPEGNASPVSDIDIICITEKENISLSDNEQPLFHGKYLFDNDPLILFNKVFSGINVEFDILFISKSKLFRILDRVNYSKCNYLSQELQVISRIINGWCFNRNEIYESLEIFKNNEKLRIFCVVRYLVGALKHVEDALVYKESNKLLTKYLINHSLEKFVQTLYAGFNLYYIGYKWLRGFDKLLIDEEIKGIFYKLYFSDINDLDKNYYIKLKKFIKTIIDFLEKDMILKIAINSNPQIYKYRYIYEH